MEILILLIIVIYFLRRDKKSYYYRSGNKQGKQKNGQECWHSDWGWDEAKQLWVHPLSGDVTSKQQPGSAVHQDTAIDFPMLISPNIC